MEQKIKDFTKMNNSQLPNALGQSIIMGALIMLTSASIITIMNAF
jgi:hypothetical protein